MNNIDNIIYRHLYCDYRFGMVPNATQTSLYESHGLIPEIDSYVLCFREFVETKMLPFIEDGGTITKVINSMEAFSSVDKPFFSSCSITVTATINDDKYSYRSGYHQDESHYNGLQNYVEIEVSASAQYPELLLSLLSTNFAHELTHAYDDYKSQTGGSAPLKDVVKDTNYQDRLIAWRLGSNQNQRIMGKMLYRLSRMELNAIVGQIYAEIQGKPVKTPQEALEAIKGTGAYGIYTFLKKNIDYINSDLDDLTKLDIAESYHFVTNEKLPFNAVKKKINSIWYQWSSKFLNNIGKIAYGYYSKTQAPMWSYSELP